MAYFDGAVEYFDGAVEYFDGPVESFVTGGTADARDVLTAE